MSDKRNPIQTFYSRLLDGVILKRERRIEQIIVDQEAREAWCDSRHDFESTTRAVVKGEP